ncbi:hypothetical protein BDK51DRAFT_38062, partial [Blyttiomyces helicus]
MASNNSRNNSRPVPPVAADASYLNTDPLPDWFSPISIFEERPPKPASVASISSNRSRLRTIMEQLSRPTGSPNRQLPAETVSSESTASALVTVSPASRPDPTHNCDTPSVDNVLFSRSSSKTRPARSRVSPRERLTSASVPSLSAQVHRDADADAERAGNDALLERSSTRISSSTSRSRKRGRVPYLLRLAPRPALNDVDGSAGAAGDDAENGRDSLSKATDRIPSLSDSAITLEDHLRRLASTSVGQSVNLQTIASELPTTPALPAASPTSLNNTYPFAMPSPPSPEPASQTSIFNFRRPSRPPSPPSGDEQPRRSTATSQRTVTKALVKLRKSCSHLSIWAAAALDRARGKGGRPNEVNGDTLERTLPSSSVEKTDEPRSGPPSLIDYVDDGPVSPRGTSLSRTSSRSRLRIAIVNARTGALAALTAHPNPASLVPPSVMASAASATASTKRASAAAHLLPDPRPSMV